MNKYLMKTLNGTEEKIRDKEYNITPGIQKVITVKSYNTAKVMNDMEKLVFRDILQKTGYYKRAPTTNAYQVVTNIFKKILTM